ncbi:MAG: hypothetical protein KC613_09855, partial [Myxococcales bacterium]|nr:hypothetical protein [Myxococcales bacterium]
MAHAQVAQLQVAVIQGGAVGVCSGGDPAQNAHRRVPPQGLAGGRQRPGQRLVAGDDHHGRQGRQLVVVKGLGVEGVQPGAVLVGLVAVLEHQRGVAGRLIPAGELCRLCAPQGLGLSEGILGGHHLHGLGAGQPWGLTVAPVHHHQPRGLHRRLQGGQRLAQGLALPVAQGLGAPVGAHGLGQGPRVEEARPAGVGGLHRLGAAPFALVPIHLESLPQPVGQRRPAGHQRLTAGAQRGVGGAPEEPQIHVRRQPHQMRAFGQRLDQVLQGVHQLALWTRLQRELGHEPIGGLAHRRRGCPFVQLSAAGADLLRQARQVVHQQGRHAGGCGGHRRLRGRLRRGRDGIAIETGARWRREMTPDEFAAIRDFVHRKSGIVLGENKGYLVESRLL